jgi:UDP-glucose 4-epimerase
VPPPPTDARSDAAVVTGGAGFVGSCLVDLLIAEGWRVLVLDDLSTGSRRNVSEEASIEVADVSDRGAVDRAIDAAHPSVIFHLSAQASVTRSVADPERDCAVNVQGTLNVLEAASRVGARVVFSSTGGAIYGDDVPIPTPEDAPPGPISPYGASKWAAEAYVSTWRRATGLEHSICRLGNVYGPRQNAHGESGVVAVFSYMLWRGESPQLFGFGRPTRDYVHVDDVARALLAAVGKGGTFNVSTGVETDVATVFSKLASAAGASVEPDPQPLRPGELERSCMDPTRAREQLGWRAEVDLDEGLAGTYQALTAGFGQERVDTA